MFNHKIIKVDVKLIETMNNRNYTRLKQSFHGNGCYEFRCLN